MSETVETVSRANWWRNFRSKPVSVRICEMPCLISITALTLAIFLTILAIGMSYERTEERPPSSLGLMIVDVDAGIDDAIAVMLLLEAEKRFYDPETAAGPKVVAITTVNGNTITENVSKNILRTLGEVNRTDVPVYQGATVPILTNHYRSDFFGVDGFGDVPDPGQPSIDLLQKGHAAVALVQIVNDNPGEITLICLGPLTNIALAIRLDEQFLTKVKHVFILGGSTKGVGNISPGLEFNFFMDPEANYIVLKDAPRSNRSMTLLTVDTPHTMDVTWGWRKTVLGEVQSPKVEFLNTIEHFSPTNMNNKTGAWDSFIDPLMAAIIINPHLILDSEDRALAVSTQGEFRGGIIADFLGSLKDAPTVEIIGNVHSEHFKSFLIDYLS